jgi:tight adherence protein C
MLWLTSGAAFLGMVLVVVALLYTFSYVDLTVPDRLSHLWSSPAAQRVAFFRERQRARVQRVLLRIGKLLPSSPKGASKTKRTLVRAGYRRPEYVVAVRSAQIILPVAFLSAAYFTQIYQMSPFFVLAFAGGLGYLLPEFWLGWRVRQRQKIIRLSLPDALDLLVVCVEAGLGLDQSIMRVSQELRIAHPELCEELDLVTAEIRVGKTRTEALRELASRTGEEDVKAWVAMLVQTDRFGTSVAQSLRVYSEDLRTKRRQRAEEMAAKTSVKMVPPLVFFIFPALFVVILGPAVISILRIFVTSVSGK